MKFFLTGILWGFKALWRFFELPVLIVGIFVVLCGPGLLATAIWDYDSVGFYVIIGELSLLFLFSIGMLFGGRWDKKGTLAWLEIIDTVRPDVLYLQSNQEKEI